MADIDFVRNSPSITANQHSVLTVKRKKSQPDNVNDGLYRETTPEPIERSDYGIIERNNKRRKIDIVKLIADKQTQRPMKTMTKTIKNDENKNTLRTKYEQIHATTVQKLTAQNEQLRNEINALRATIATTAAVGGDQRQQQQQDRTGDGQKTK